MLVMDVESDSETEIEDVRHEQSDTDSDIEEKKFICDICGKRLLLKILMEEHIICHLMEETTFGEAATTKQRWPCDGCKRTFSTESSLLCHKSTYTGLHKFLCDECGVIFLTHGGREKHAATQHSDKSNTAGHTCHICSDKFNDVEFLRIHLEEAHNHKRDSSGFPLYTCSYCEETFFNEETVRYHENAKHNGNRKRVKRKSNRRIVSHNCKTCSSNFTSKRALMSHLKTHKAKKRKIKLTHFQCLICPRSFSSSDGLKYHLATHTGEKPYACSKCKRRFIKKTHLSEHVATHSTMKFFGCNNCPKRFSTHSAFKKHMKMFPGPHNFQCKKCGKTFMKESMLVKHLCVDLVAVGLAPEIIAQLSEDNVEEYMCFAEEVDDEAGIHGMLPCCKCFKVFRNKDALYKHQKEHLNNRVYQCRFCPEAFNRCDAFSAHIVHHLGSTPYMCKVCKRKFISPITLATHLKNYPGDHSFTCKRCKRWFPSVGRMEKHDCILQNLDVFTCACLQNFHEWREFVDHLGNPPYKCCSCEQVFLSPATLTQHIKWHTGTRPFTCQKCNKTFSTRAIYRGHLKIHENLRQLSCELCDYKTLYQKRLDFHIMKRHEIEATTLCPVCGILFPSFSKFKKHLQIEHEDSVILSSDEPRKKSAPSGLCPLCGKMLINKYSLRLHIQKKHGANDGQENKRLENTRPVSCTVCNILCDSPKLLRKHMKQHEASKPFSCPTCSKRFKVAASLKYHSKICSNPQKNEEQNQWPHEKTF